MRKTINQIPHIFLTLSFILILADCGFMSDVYSPYNFSLHRECTDISNHVEHSHSHFFHINIIIIDSKQKPNKLPGEIERIPLLRFNFKNLIFSNIWQPPRFS